MGTIGKVILNDHVNGDTFDGVLFTFLLNDEEFDLTGATCRIRFRYGRNDGDVILTLISPDDITVTDNTIYIKPFIPDLKPGQYYFDVQLTFLSGRIKTYIKGSWKILTDVS